MQRWARFLICCPLAACIAQAQDVSSQPLFPPSYVYLLRLEREADNTKTCVLLKKDGSFHYERNHNDEHVTVYEGELPAEGLAKVQSLLRRPDLANLKQGDIPVPLFNFGDQIQVNVFRQDHWQDLVFPDSKDREKLVPTVDALVDWLGTLPRLPHRQFTEFEARNNCLTEHKIELRARPLPPPAITAPKLPQVEGLAPPPESRDVAPRAKTPPAPSFSLSMTVTRFGNPMQRRCVVIYPDGRFHTERTTQSYGEHATYQVMEGMYPPQFLDSLQQVLSAPEWKLEYKEQLPNQVFIRGGEMVHVEVPGPGHILKSAFMNVDYQPLPNLNEVPVQTTDIAAIPGGHQKLVAPLRAWFKKNIEDVRFIPTKDAIPYACKPPG